MFTDILAFLDEFFEIPDWLGKIVGTAMWHIFMFMITGGVWVVWLLFRQWRKVRR